MSILSYFRRKEQIEANKLKPMSAKELDEKMEMFFQSSTATTPITISSAGGYRSGSGSVLNSPSTGTLNTYQTYPYAPTPIVTIHPYGYNNQPITDNLAIIAIRTFADVHANGCFQHNDIVLCLDTKEMFMYSSPLMTGESTWYKIEILPNLVIEIQEFAPNTTPAVPVQVKEDRQEIYDAFEKNLKPIEKLKHDSTSLIDKAKDWLRAPLEPVTQSYQ